MSLEGKSLHIQQGIEIIKMLTQVLVEMRLDDSFEVFWKRALERAEELGVDEPILPRQRRPLRQMYDGGNLHTFVSPRDVYRKLYFEVTQYQLG